MNINELNVKVDNKFLNPGDLGLGLRLVEDTGDKILLQSTTDPHLYYIAEVLAVNRHEFLQLKFMKMFRSQRVVAGFKWLASNPEDIVYIDDDHIKGEVSEMTEGTSSVEMADGTQIAMKENVNVLTEEVNNMETAVVAEPIKVEPIKVESVKVVEPVKAAESVNVEPVIVIEPMELKDFVKKYYALNKITFISIGKTYKPDKTTVYDCVKGAWKTSDKITKSELVMAEYKGRIVGIFRPNQWNLNNDHRYEFVGVELELPKEYANIRINKKPGTANPIRYGF